MKLHFELAADYGRITSNPEVTALNITGDPTQNPLES
jgi:hypothetical protein